MADTKATALTAATILRPTDLLMGVDVTDTTMAASGSTKRYSPAIVAAGLPVFVASGASHAVGLVPDPGVTAGNTRFLREDSTWNAPGGGTVFVGSGAGHAVGLVPDPGVTAGTTRYLREDATWFVPPGGGGGTPGGSNLQLQYNNSGAFGGLANWALGAGGQITGTSIADPGSPAAGDMWVSSTQKCFSRLNSGCVVRDGGVMWASTGPSSALVNSVGPASLLAGATSVGSLVIPANALVPGKLIRLRFVGIYGAASATPFLIFQMYLGSTMVLGGSSGTGLAAQTNGSFICYGFDMLIQSVGASGKAIGMGTVSLASSVQVGVGTLYFTSGLGSAIAQVTVDTTAALAVDLRATWSVADPLNSVRVLGAVVEILG